MRKDIGAKTVLYPLPVLIIAAYGRDGKVQAMNAAWGGIADDYKVAVCLSSYHKTVEAIRQSGAFSVSFADSEHVAEADYLGIASGNKDPDKFAHSGLHAAKGPKLGVPIIDEFPVALECSVEDIAEIADQTLRVIGRIENVSADEKAFDGDGLLNISKVDPIVYDTVRREYYSLGGKVADAFSCGKKLMPRGASPSTGLSSAWCKGPPRRCVPSRTRGRPHAVGFLPVRVLV